MRLLFRTAMVFYGFSRFGRYAFDISQVLGIFRDLSRCDRTPIVKAGEQAKKMIRLSIKAFTDRDVTAVAKLNEMDDLVDNV